MKRNIVTTIEFSKDHLSVNVLEKLSHNFVEIFSQIGDITNAYTFLASTFRQIEAIIGGTISEVVVVIEESQHVNASIELVKNSVGISNELVSERDVNHLIKLTKDKYKKVDKKIILVQPLQFEVKDIVTKKYSQAPIYKKGETLSATFAFTYIGREAWDFIESVIESHQIAITQVLLKSQTISQNNLSQLALSSGAILVHIDHKQTFVSINKNYGTISSMAFYGVGFDSLISIVAKHFECSQAIAKNLISVHGDLLHWKNQVISTYENDTNGVKEIKCTTNELKQLMQNFVKKILVLSQKFITQKNVENLPVVLSGDITKINNFQNFAKNIFTGITSIYAPMSFIEANSANHNSLGFLNWSKRLDEIYGKQFNTIVETNPNIFASWKKHTKKGFWTKFLGRLGGKYDWN